MRAKSVQRPLARSTKWSRVKSNQPTIGPPKAAPRDSLPRRERRPRRLAAGQAVPNQAMPRVAVAADPAGLDSTIAAASQRAGQSGAADVTAASNREHLAAAPIALPKRTALRQ